MTAHGAMTSLMTQLQDLSDAEHLILKSWVTSDGTEFPALGTPPEPRAASAAEDPVRADVAGLLRSVSHAAQSIAALPVFYQENGANRTRLVLNQFPFDWNELYEMLNT